MEQIIRIRDLFKTYGTFKAVDGLNLDVFKGDVFGFLGPNGAGKSTTIRMILSLIKPDSGTIELFGMPLSTHRIEILKKIGCIVERPDFYNYLSGISNLRIFSKLSGITPTDSRIDEVLDLVGLKGRGKDPVKNYSHGMKQRLGLAQTLIHDPELIILDEPVNGLDPQGIIDIRNLIRYLSKEKGKTIFLSSHILSEVEIIADSMCIINKGKTIVQGKMAELMQEKERLVVFGFADTHSALNWMKESRWNHRIKNTHSDSIELNLSQAEIPELNAALVTAKLQVTSIISRKPLEDLFLKLTENNSLAN